MKDFVYPYGPAFNGGVRKGDVIIKINLIKAKDIDSLPVFLNKLPDKQDVILQVM
jgi:S1-C subfamily serine protease